MMRCRMVSLIIRSRIADIHFRIDTQSECPLESPAETEPVQELVQRVKFRMQLYPMHCRRTSESESVRTIRSDHQIKGRRSDFLCWICQGRGPLTKMVRTQLLTIFTNFSVAQDLSRFTAQCVIKSERMTQSQVDDFKFVRLHQS